MTGKMQQTKPERLASWTAAILRIIEDKQVLLRLPAASTHVPALASHRWQLTKAVCKYRWFVKSALAAHARSADHNRQVTALIEAIDDVHEVLRAYVLHWSNGDNAARWPDYQAAASATLDEIARAVRRISADAATLLPDAAPPGDRAVEQRKVLPL